MMRRNMMDVAKMIAKKKYAKGGMVGSPEEFDDNADPRVTVVGPKMPDSISMEKMDEDADDTMMTQEENKLNSFTDVGDGEISNPNEQKEAMNFADALRNRAKQLTQESYAMGGLVEGKTDGPLGNKPALDLDSGVEDKEIPDHVGTPQMKDPMGPGISSEAMDAIKRKKMMMRMKMMA